MKRIVLSMISMFPFVGVLACGSGDSAGRINVGVMTFNVLCSFCNDQYDPWEERLDYFADIMQRHDPDLLGLQELTWASEVDQFLAFMDGYEAAYFVGQTPGPLGQYEYPDAAILYRAARFELEENGFYWLSPTPDEPWSSGFSENLQLPRLVNWARLLEKNTGREIVFITTHFDNNSPSQELSAPLLLERTAPWADELPVIVTGDFNSQPADEAYHILTEGVAGDVFHLTNAFDIVAEWSLDSNQDPAPDYDTTSRIDHIFTAGKDMTFDCSAWTADLHVYGQGEKYPSDHWPIAARLSF
ncbi:MAG TPA: endonuclease/exonuclease/phosphatase family protein [Myxococcota bacterium]|nr:endonuclease/exonuclease/phosphatase family protein [Myxococcota bacterium]